MHDIDLKQLLGDEGNEAPIVTLELAGVERRVLSQKELAKEKRHAMYQSAKERRATDPRYLAMKEAAKVQRRVAYQKLKDHRKAVAADEKAKRKEKHAVEYAGRRVEADRELMKLITWVSKSSTAQND